MPDPITAISDLIKTGLNKFVRDKVDEATMAEIKTDFDKHVITEAGKENSSFREFVLAYSGTMKDYKDIPVVGYMVILFRGLIRPAITVMAAYWTHLYITGAVGLEWTPDKVNLLKSIDLLVLFFWFGERAVKNSGLVGYLVDKVKAVK